MNPQARPELLAPAGSLAKLKIALEYGADAVYAGLGQFSLRNRASKNFDLESFKEGVALTHAQGKKFYATLNAFPFNSQIKLLEEHLAKLADCKVDALIIATIGVLKLAQKLTPHIPIHLSTQANVMNVLDARAFYEMGVKRIVVAREMSLNDVVAIKKELPDLELEVFVHGSMCFAFSGRCLISALQHGRVPNRGSCANDCRFDYEYYIKNPDTGVMMRLEEEEGIGTHILNAKDLNLANHIATILDSQAVSALKIEGRTKSSYYAAITTKTYRTAIEDYYNNQHRPALYQAELATLKNRGFTEGYLIQRPHQRLDTQNFKSAISEGDFQVNGEVLENGEYFLCKFTTRPNEVYEVVLPYGAPFEPTTNEIGKLYRFEGKHYLSLFKIILLDGRELESIHSGNTNPVKLPAKLPAFSFLRTRA
ncbi:peptidase U32 family protein [Helicobacter bizzozeronii]|uniref:peptidase U32 family protein n=1 Tax=Helicobacter bizzozeronii TaxID=56877 RepID=UPI000CED9CF6|nr:peptidase U32 family protein [Helicobacter bizzozeronii]